MVSLCIPPQHLRSLQCWSWVLLGRMLQGTAQDAVPFPSTAASLCPMRQSCFFLPPAQPCTTDVSQLLLLWVVGNRPNMWPSLHKSHQPSGQGFPSDCHRVKNPKFSVACLLGWWHKGPNPPQMKKCSKSPSVTKGPFWHLAEEPWLPKEWWLATSAAVFPQIPATPISVSI